MLRTAITTLPPKSARNCSSAMNPLKAIVLPKPHRAYHKSPYPQCSAPAVLLSANLCQRSTVDTALEISSNEPAIFRLPMSNHKEEGGFVSKGRIIGLIYLADRLHLRYLYRTRLTKCIVEQFDE
jgi:hypothetical protein